METINQINNNSDLWKSFIEFQKDFKGMQPDATNPFFKSSYITLDGILETVRPLLAKHGLAVLQEAKGVDGSVTIKTRLVHESGQYYETDILEMKPQKANDPQQMGSCITYSKRYQLSALLGICESVDDDGNAATYGNGKSPNSSKNDNSTKSYKCASCGNEVTEKVAKFSYSKHKQILCMDCQKKSK
ncbi:recombinase [Clostridium botulinum]|nr:recombinase [Clostridium botulinum]